MFPKQGGELSKTAEYIREAVAARERPRSHLEHPLRVRLPRSASPRREQTRPSNEHIDQLFGC